MISVFLFLQEASNILNSEDSGLLEGLYKTIFPFIVQEDNWILPSIFIGIVVSVFIGFIWYALRNYYKSKSKINYLIKQLQKTSKESIHTDFENLKSRILGKSEFDSVWREFEKSIIKIKESGETKVYSTTGAGQHFNDQNIVRSQLNVRLLNSASGILVTLGLIGTFIGISAGLGEISFAGNNSEELNEGITTLLGGAQVAFSSSVWGLILSLCFNFFEKNLIQRLSYKVAELQQVIDGLFEKKSSEEILAHSLNEEKKQTVQLQTFNDDLVLRLGEVLDKSIQENFNPVLEILLDAVQELTEFKKESASNAIERMISEFKTSMTDGANSQMKELSGTLQETAQLLNKANEKTANDQAKMQDILTAHLEQFENRMDNIMSSVNENQKELNAQQKEAINDVLNSLKNGVDQTDEHFKSMLESTESSVNGNLKEIKDMFSSLSEDYEHNLSDLKEHFTSEKETMGEMIQKINNQLRSFDQSINSMNKSSKTINEVLPVIESSTNNLRESTSKFKESQIKFLDEVSFMLQKTNDVTTGNTDLLREIKNALEETREHWRAYEERFDGLKEDLNGVFSEMSIGLNTYQEETKSGLTNSLQQFDSIMGKSIASLSTGIDEMKELLEDIEINSNNR